MAVEIHNPEQLENWLKDKPAEWGRLLALRATLRALPLIRFAENRDDLRVSLFRAMAIFWSVCRYPAHDVRAVALAAAEDSTRSSMDNAAFGSGATAPAAAAAHLAEVNGPANALGVANCVDAAARGVAAIWSEVDRDIAILEERPGTILGPLISQPLWNGSVPTILEEAWRWLAVDMVTRDPNARVWSEWYDRRRIGTDFGFALSPPDDMAITLRLVDQPNEFWERGFAAVNADIAGWIAEALAPESLPDAEPQNPIAPIFTSDEEGRIDLDARAGNDEIRRDGEAIDRHSEALAAADRALGECSGNAASRTRVSLERYRDALGVSIDALRPGQIIPRGEALRQELIERERDIAENRDTDLPPLPGLALLALRAVVSAHNHLVQLDPALARRDLALFNPESISSQVSRADAKAMIAGAVEAGFATDEARDVIESAVDNAPVVPDLSSRQSRFLSEAVRNFLRKAVSSLVVIAKAGVAATLAAYGLGHWALANEGWILSQFIGNQSMLDLIARLMEILRHLPLT